METTFISETETPTERWQRVSHSSVRNEIYGTFGTGVLCGSTIIGIGMLIQKYLNEVAGICVTIVGILFLMVGLMSPCLVILEIGEWTNPVLVLKLTKRIENIVSYKDIAEIYSRRIYNMMKFGIISYEMGQKITPIVNRICTLNSKLESLEAKFSKRTIENTEDLKNIHDNLVNELETEFQKYLEMHDEIIRDLAFPDISSEFSV